MAHRTVLFDNSALVDSGVSATFTNRKSGLRPVGEMIGDGKNYEITLEANVPVWVLEHFVKPLGELARGSDGAITLAIRQKDGPLA